MPAYGGHLSTATRRPSGAWPHAGGKARRGLTYAATPLGYTPISYTYLSLIT